MPRGVKDRRATNCHRFCRRPQAGALSAVEGDRRYRGPRQARLFRLLGRGSREPNDLNQAKPYQLRLVASCQLLTARFSKIPPTSTPEGCLRIAQLKGRSKHERGQVPAPSHCVFHCRSAASYLNVASLRMRDGLRQQGVVLFLRWTT
jgi:hypothetical protein